MSKYYFTKEDCKYWGVGSPMPKDEKKVSGPLADIPVDKKNKHEVLYMVNAILEKYQLNKEAGRIIERTLIFDVPKPFLTQRKIAEWIYENRLKRIEEKLRRD